jgi:hypothetical protein
MIVTLTARRLKHGSQDAFRAFQEQAGREEQLTKLAPYIDEVLLDGSYEVLDEITP